MRSRLRVLLRLGFPLLRQSLALVFLYLALHVVAITFIQTQVPQKFNILVQSGGLGAIRWHDYMVWLLLAILLLPGMAAFKYISSLLDNAMRTSLKNSLFQRLLTLSPVALMGSKPEDLARIVNDSTTQSEVAIRTMILDPPLQMIHLVVALYAVLKQLQSGQYVMAACIVVLGVASTFLATMQGANRIARAQSQMQSLNFSIASLVNGATAAPEEIQVFNAQESFASRYLQQLRDYMRMDARQGISLELFNQVIGLPEVIACAILFGNALRSPGSAKNLAALAFLVPQVFIPFRTLAGLAVQLASFWPSIEQVDQLLRSDATIKENPGATDHEIHDSSVEFRNVRFAYPSGRQVLRDASFRTEPGSITALVARIGQGKTTIFRLLLRSIERDSGQILIGGEDINSFTLASLHNHIAILPQKPAFFRESLLINFQLGRPEATKAQIQRQCESLGTELWPALVQSFGPDPLEATFRPEGISGGQIRLMALARTLLRDPKLLLLDEPGANLDNFEKEAISQVLLRVARNRTLLVVDHDLNWLSHWCSQMVVLNDGVVVQQGTGENLSRQPGVFHSSFRPIEGVIKSLMNPHT
jgi:ABC-type multidrug transport system fused ATPase/permease subunit